MSETYCDLLVATYGLSDDVLTLEEIEELVAKLKAHGDATYCLHFQEDESEDGWYTRFCFNVTKRFYEGSPEYAEWLQEKEAAELSRKLEQLRYDQQVKEQKQQAKERNDRQTMRTDTRYWHYVNRFAATGEQELRWVGYVPTYTKEACGVVGEVVALPDLGIDPDSWGK